MNKFIYGHWRGLPAREERATGKRWFFQDYSWQGPLGVGYHDEFVAWPDQISGDAWEQKHKS